MEELKIANDKLNAGLSDTVKNLGMQIDTEMSQIAGHYNDEISLLN